MRGSMNTSVLPHYGWMCWLGNLGAQNNTKPVFFSVQGHDSKKNASQKGDIDSVLMYSALESKDTLRTKINEDFGSFHL